ncbi:hypothetical protein LZ32DRAFT_370415 [Colletotrichum eremochloae]|nr:hypothetical protein LZ32DRAFT_370415 [Colletotrichum eremochloae]
MRVRVTASPSIPIDASWSTPATPRPVLRPPPPSQMMNPLRGTLPLRLLTGLPCLFFLDLLVRVDRPMYMEGRWNRKRSLLFRKTHVLNQTRLGDIHDKEALTWLTDIFGRVKRHSDRYASLSLRSRRQIGAGTPDCQIRLGGHLLSKILKMQSLDDMPKNV